ncbi:MAG: SIMPL domain-containing protein [Acidobacteriota bacterium]|nr:SIMPL domain-containing protein [Acidobacteriota bacterium]
MQIQGRALVLLTALGTLAGVPAAGAQVRTPVLPVPAMGTTVVATGDATVRHAPDRAFVTLAVESRAPRPADAQQANAAVMTRVQQKLEALGLPKSAIETTAYDLQQEADYENGKRIPKDFLATNAIQVTVDDLGRVGTVIDTAVGAGATNVRGVRFDLKDRSGVEREALRQAVADAKLNAEALASGAGMTLDRIVRIDSTGAVSTPRPVNTALLRAAPEAAPTPIAPGDLEIHAHVTLTAVLKQD